MHVRIAFIAAFLLACDIPPTTSTSEGALACDLSAPGALGNACDKAASPTPITAQPLAGTTVTTIDANDRAYGVRLVAGASGNEGVVTFVPPETATYQIYFSAQNLAFRVVSDDGTVVAPTCTTALTSTDCAYLRKVMFYDLVGGHSYRIELGPVATLSYVRLYIQTRIATPRVCNGSEELTVESEACASTTGTTQPLTAATIISPPEIAEDTVYGITLPSDGSGYAGSVAFVPATDGDFEFYLGDGAIPLRVIGSSEPAVMTCSQYIPSTECKLLRRGERVSMRGGKLYRFEFGPSTTYRYVRMTIRRSAVVRTVHLGPPTHIALDSGAFFVKSADLDGDGVLDLETSVANDASGIAEITPLRGSGTGSFTAQTSVTTSLPGETMVSDFSHDGIPDIVGIAFDGQGPLPGFYLQGTGAFAYTKSTWGNGRDFEHHLSSGDFNEDGTVDLVAAWSDSTSNTGPGGFVITTMPTFTVVQDEPAFGNTTLQAVAGDFNGDGHQDVVVASRTSSALKLYLGDGSGRVTFAQDITLPGGPIVEIAALYLNGTYYEELVAIHADNTVTVSYGTINGIDPNALQLLVDNHSFFGGIAAGDFDHDGLLDLAIGEAGPSSEIVVFLSTQNGYVRAATLSQGGEMTVGDFNGDGFDDLAATTLDGIDVYLSTP